MFKKLLLLSLLVGYAVNPQRLVSNCQDYLAVTLVFADGSQQSCQLGQAGRSGYIQTINNPNQAISQIKMTSMSYNGWADTPGWVSNNDTRVVNLNYPAGSSIAIDSGKSPRKE